jgi:hypothetical protein
MTTSIPSELSGRAIDCLLGPITPRLTFKPGSLHIHLQVGDHVIDEDVEVEVARVRPHVFAMSWLERSGNFIVQVQDYEKAIVHNYARLASGELFCTQGTIRPVVAA